MNEALEAIRSTQAKHRDIRAAKKAKPNPTAWHKIWHDELRALYPAFVMVYSDAVSANLQRAVKSRGLPVEDVGPMIAWIVRNWPLIRRKVFSRNPKYLGGPETPDMRVVISYLPQIHGLFNLSKPEYALASRKLANSVEPTAPTPLAPAPKPAPTPAAARPKRPILRPLAIDIEAADAARKRLNLPKWD